MIGIRARQLHGCSRPFADDALPNTPRGYQYGRPQKKNFAVAPWHAPSADAIKKPTYVEDKDSGELRRPHHLDLKTGMYKGRQVLKKKDA